MMFRELPVGSYFRLEGAAFSEFRCRKVEGDCYVQLLDDTSGLTEETRRRSYSDFRVVPIEKKETAGAAKSAG